MQPTTTNIVGVGDITRKTVTVDIASTPYDTIDVQELFGNSGNYTLYTNNGANTLDKHELQVNQIVLIKDAPHKKYNGVYQVIDIQQNTQGFKFSRCVRSAFFKTFHDVLNAFITVKPTGIYGGSGDINPSLTFLCIEPQASSGSFVLDTDDITFAGFGVNELRTMSVQDKEDVNITGGTINVPTIQTNVIQPQDSSASVSVDLNGASEYHKFEVSENDNTLFSVNGLGVASAQSFYEPSDRNLKKNDTQIHDAIELVKKLRGVTFDWKDNSRKTNRIIPITDSSRRRLA